MQTSLQPSPVHAARPAAPRHVAIIMDGNRRWARARGLPAIAGHQRGADAVRRTVDTCLDAGVGYLTLFAFSSENWKRPWAEINELMNLLRFYLQREVDEAQRSGVRVQFLGERDLLAADILELMHRAEIGTATGQRLVLTIALNYGSRREIARAARRLAERVAQGELRPEDIDEDLFASALDAHDLPDPDLLIRTSGELRISNFLLWQLAYTELVFEQVQWPEFGREHLLEAFAEYRRRERRYGASSG
jgi:undecaprenyl diphosphate synthase